MDKNELVAAAVDAFEVATDQAPNDYELAVIKDSAEEMIQSNEDQK